MDASTLIPQPRPDDEEDVHWALSTASALWGRGERSEALKWLRRAADRAMDCDADARSIELSKAAANLTAAMSVPPPAPSVVPPPLPVTPAPSAAAPPTPPPSAAAAPIASAHAGHASPPVPRDTPSTPGSATRVPGVPRTPVRRTPAAPTPNDPAIADDPTIPYTRPAQATVKFSTEPEAHGTPNPAAREPQRSQSQSQTPAPPRASPVPSGPTSQVTTRGAPNDAEDPAIATLPALRVALTAGGASRELRAVVLESTEEPEPGAALALIVPATAAAGEAILKLLRRES